MTSFANPLRIQRPIARYCGRGLMLALSLLTLYACTPLTPTSIPLADRADTRLITAPAASYPAPDALLTQVMAAELAIARGDLASATRRYGQIAQTSQDPALIERAVELALRRDQTTDARALAERWVRFAPDSIDAQQLYGLLALRDGSINVARRAFQSSLPDAKSEREAALARLGALLLDPELPDAVYRIMQTFAAMEPDSPAAQLAFARVAFVRERVEPALSAINAALQQRPDWMSARLLKTDILFALERPDEALAELDQLLAEAPDNFALRREYARILLRLGEDRRALDEYRRLLANNENEPQMLSTAAILAMEAGDIAMAQEALQRLREDNPSFAPRSFLLEGEMLRIEGNFNASRAILDQALAAYPQNTELLYARAMTAISAGDLVTAEADLRRILADQPNDARALNALGYTLVDQTQRLDEGSALIERAYAQAPDDPAIIDSMGWAAYRRGQPAQALEYIRRAHTLTEGDPEIAAHLGEVLWSLGQREQARAVWAAAQAKDTDHPVLIETLQRLDPE